MRSRHWSEALSVLHVEGSWRGTLATGSWDGALKLWDLESGALLWTSWQTNNIQRLAFAPDGRTLASSGSLRATGTGCDSFWRSDIACTLLSASFCNSGS